ncbi:MAG TPA: response regulator, partial [Phycisphaerales bacterium]|nr:response regulator [Phycisphaerales bacterium]
MATVLIVDDSHLSRSTLRIALAKTGVAVIEASDGVAG